MKVSTLIEKLQEFDPDLEVRIPWSDYPEDWDAVSSANEVFINPEGTVVQEEELPQMMRPERYKQFVAITKWKIGRDGFDWSDDD